jgi:hypothetical protein
MPFGDSHTRMLVSDTGWTGATPECPMPFLRTLATAA